MAGTMYEEEARWETSDEQFRSLEEHLVSAAGKAQLHEAQEGVYLNGVLLDVPVSAPFRRLCPALRADLRRRLSAPEPSPGNRHDLIVCDEAHKLSATFFGGEIKHTKRHRLGQLLFGLTRHFLLMAATPHNGKGEDFQLFLALLDGDRFAGRFRDGVHQVEVSDPMRRMVKEKLLKCDGRPRGGGGHPRARGPGPGRFQTRRSRQTHLVLWRSPTCPCSPWRNDVFSLLLATVS
jgi:hypothetical protein